MKATQNPNTAGTGGGKVRAKEKKREIQVAQNFNLLFIKS
jgi:hypothetical protein